ncbi:hypothetical protein Tco_0685036 [Tanacetum coccineum]
MAYSSSSSNANSKVHTCSTECEQSYAQLKKLYDTQREQLSDASIEIQAYTQALKKVETQLVVHQKNQLWYKEKIRFMKIDLDDKTDVLTYHKKLLAEAVKEKEELKTKLESFETSSKSLNTLLNSQLSANDKAGFGHNGAKESKSMEEGANYYTALCGLYCQCIVKTVRDVYMSANNICKELASPKQKAFGKDFSNPLMADTAETQQRSKRAEDDKEEFGYIPPVYMELTVKKLDD